MRAAFFAYFFLLLKKSRSPHAVGTGVANASKATHKEAEPNALRKSVPHSSFLPNGRQDTDNLKTNWYNNRIELIPVRPVRQMRGFIPGIETDVPRKEDRI